MSVHASGIPFRSAHPAGAPPPILTEPHMGGQQPSVLRRRESSENAGVETRAAARIDRRTRPFLEPLHWWCSFVHTLEHHRDFTP